MTKPCVRRHARRDVHLRWLVIATIGAVACSQRNASPSTGIAIEHAVAPELLATGDATTGTMAVYLTIANGGRADTLDSIATPVAAHAAVHAQMQHGGMSMMMPAEDLAIPANGVVRLEPGGYHIMLEQVATRLVAGDSLRIVLHFRHAGPQSAVVPVVRYTALDSALAGGRKNP